MLRSRALLFAVALLLRLAACLVLDTPGDGAGQTPWAVGGEAPTLAAALVDGRGLADPWLRPGDGWDVPTGPSSWLTPVYPALVAVCMRLGGAVSSDPELATSLAPSMTATALWLLYAVQALASALTCVLLVSLGRRLGLPRAGWLGGWLFALYPLAIWNAVGVVWDTTLVAFGITACLVALLAWGRGWGGLVGSGLCFGALLLLNPAPVAMLPGIWLWIALGPASGPERTPGAARPTWLARLAQGAPRAAVYTAAALAVCVPWMLRNNEVLGTLVLRPNFGVELRLGNHDEASGRPLPFRYHPSHVEAERALYVELGEAGYGSENTARALDWIRSHPGRFAALTARRIGLFWWGELPTADGRASAGVGAGNDPASWVKFLVYSLTGVGALVALAVLWRRGGLAPEHAFLLILALVCFGGPYYLTHVSERYRFPIDPLLVLLDAWLVLWILRRADPDPHPALDSGGTSMD